MRGKREEGRRWELVRELGSLGVGVGEEGGDDGDGRKRVSKGGAEDFRGWGVVGNEASVKRRAVETAHTAGEHAVALPCCHFPCRDARATAGAL